MHDLSQGITVVTGGAGLIGSATIWGLNNRGLENVWAVDDFKPGSLKERNLLPWKLKSRSEFKNLETYSGKIAQN